MFNLRFFILSAKYVELELDGRSKVERSWYRTVKCTYFIVKIM